MIFVPTIPLVIRQPDHRSRPAFSVIIDDDNDSAQVEAARRRWPDALMARLLLNGTNFTRAAVLAAGQLANLRSSWPDARPTRDAIGGWNFAERLGVTGVLATMLNRMFFDTNFRAVDDEWAWKNLFEAGIASVPPLSAA